MTAEQRQKCKKIERHYGADKQKMQAIQELSELILLLTRRHDQQGQTYRNDLKTEIADSLIMIQQMCIAFNISTQEISEEINGKLNRQIERIKNEIWLYDP